jgi:DNA helicase-2/ATP-dependent DNA helicase PcrA
MNLNEEQKKAVETTEGPVLIVAGAGSGKTKVITHRILNLMKKGIPASSILAITFTNKAAREMKDRVGILLSEDNGLNRPISSNERPFISTFHALGVHIIRENASKLGLNKHFSIYDRSDSKRAIKEAMENCNIDPKKFDPNMILNLISRAKGDGMNYIQYRDTAKGFMEEMTADIWEKYDIIMNKEKSLDFDDLLLKTAQLLGNNSVIREHYNNVWKYIHIDEYQDTNKVQYQISRYLAEKNRNICVVGDADQNIYTWRGATIENILKFEKDYPESTVITLEKNYRSTKTILSAANSVIERNTLRKKKKLYTDNEDGEKISLFVSYTEQDEARTIADTTKELIKSGVSPSQIAVLYRTNFQSRVLEEFFLKKNLPYQLLGTKFFERKEIKDIIAYIKASLNREGWGDIGRCINTPTRGIGKATLAKLASGQENLINESTKVKIADFWKLLDDIKEEIHTKKPSEVIKFVLENTGLERSLRTGDNEDEERILNARELVSVAKQYDHLSSDVGMETFLTNAALSSDQDEIKENSEAVKLMTVHAAKGLEFEHVFVAGLEENLFPLKHLDEGEISKSEEEEERRLFYVAITRAKKKLYLSYSIVRTIYGSERVNAPSEFINDIEKKLIEENTEPKPTGVKAIFIDF